jgi:hypothetical protein
MDRIAEIPVTAWISYNCDRPGGFRQSLAYYTGHVLDESSAPIWQQRLISTHPATKAPSQHKSGGFHERIVALVQNGKADCILPGIVPRVHDRAGVMVLERLGDKGFAKRRIPSIIG